VHHAKDEAMAINNQAATTHEQEVAPPEAWDAIAGGYDEFVAPGEAPFANAGLRLAGLKSGERFLDVAAGPGGLSLPAAARRQGTGDRLVPGDDRTV
jgi:ubiquinone/menaquinone biosynthesis C-methylase UbiE